MSNEVVKSSHPSASPESNPLRFLKNRALEDGFKVVLKGGVGYDQSREIANSRINLLPCAVAFPHTAQHVAFCVQCCRQFGMKLRIRSGGHHHEGMSSANDELVVRLSEMNTITYPAGSTDRAWIPVGAKLEDVYYELELRNRIIPGGGCQAVNVGGLTQGGGWGSSARMYGLTCDNILEAEIVLADGRIVIANKDNQYSDLFWAIRGGGGGNFGIVTRFLFRLSSLTGNLSGATLWWDQPDMERIVKKWMEIQPGFPKELTSLIRLTAMDGSEGSSEHRAVMLSARFYGTTSDLERHLQPLMDCAKPASESKIKSIPINDPPPPACKPCIGSGETLSSPVHDSAMLVFAFFQTFFGVIPLPTGEIKSPPLQTCDAPHPHKVSSAFQRSPEDNMALAGKLAAYVNQVTDLRGANKIVTLHSLGGAISPGPPEGTAFPYRDKQYLVQFQSWWSDPSDPNGPAYINWVTNCRADVQSHLEGAFINFLDASLPVKNPGTPEGKIELLSYYYATNLDRLRKTKRKYDPDDFFNWQMSIPPETTT